MRLYVIIETEGWAWAQYIQVDKFLDSSLGCMLRIR